ncbi:bifunctional diguanylate cyclase/phosphohydrolase [Clostridium butyricum]|uniref:Ggdef/hd domain protein n=1 Tax=Clostridium butyricum E4 str. BoNT E BL5262 TaxID=632245 RepID=C4II83_CLOBU|nr:diguanylate cyclase [Clostridium butyricum]EDT75809.1 ggdef/hd domain protein [Clostridium butyricum 5521]EEP54971.1 ggdef/hd domain protein [Clostridium butyricum E4 str. BoNT E BL5262]NFL30151.1 diguanylate cyclase [Clostridium butyricum]NFS17747.1 diguanylate cyclase [Clostridium butyricum]
MKDVRNDRRNQINDIVSIVKVSSLLFVGIILCKTFNTNISIFMFELKNYNEYVFFSIPLIIIILIYCIWSFSNKKRKYSNIFNNFEIVLFISMFSLITLICGINQSQYKVLYLFIIITTTIQFGMKSGIIVSIISSFIILVMDLIFIPSSEISAYFQDDLLLAGIFFLTALPLGFYVKIEKQHIEKLENMINIDGLTELYNHRYFCDSLAEEIKIGEKENSPVSMIFIDIDYFKNYNDIYGHQKGDYVLKKIGKIIKSSIGNQHISARYGGEEFAIILPDTTEDMAVNIAESLRKKIENTYFEGEENQPNGKLTVSMGVSVYPDKARSDIELIKSADDALYRAKFFYKNRVETYISILDEIKSNIDEEDAELVTSIKTLISVINAKDRYTYGHVERVVVYGRMLAESLGLNERDKNILIYGSYMHDIGKINISKDVLIKKMKLTDDEWEVLKQHPANGVEIIKSVKSLNMIIPLIISHHEKYDGTGYPNNLKGDEIPYLARVLTVIDSFDAMTSNRPYNKRKTYKEAIEELQRCRGTHFDPEIVKVFIKALKTNYNIN